MENNNKQRQDKEKNSGVKKETEFWDNQISILNISNLYINLYYSCPIGFEEVYKFFWIFLIIKQISENENKLTF